MNTQNNFHHVRVAAGSEILAVIEGLPIDACGHFLSNDQMEAIEAALAVNATALTTANDQLVEANQQLTTLTGQLTTANDQLALATTQLAANASQTTDAAANADDLSTVKTGWEKFETSVDQEAKTRYLKFK